MKLFKIGENTLNTLSCCFDELPHKHLNLINAMKEILRGLEEIVEPKQEQVKE